MAATLTWIDEDRTILVIRYEATLQPADVLMALDQMTERLNDVDHPVYLITDLSEAVGIPGNMISSYPRIARHPGVRHPNLASRVVVIDNDAMISVIKIFDKLFVRLHIVRSYDDALLLIDRQRTAQPKASED